MPTPDPLHLPATIPGLLRRGSPVVFYSVRDAVAVEVSGVVVEAGPDRATVASADRALVGSRALMDLSLDLHDATARRHALLWLAKKEGRELCDMVRWGFGPGHYWPHGVDLADLDPTSDERLADGSRRVDALALARVVAHVAGVGR